MVDNLTASILAALNEKKKKKAAPTNPAQVRVGLPKKRVPEGDSIVPFIFLLKNAIKYQPDEANSEHVDLQDIKKVKFKNGAKGVITHTLTDLPQYKNKHRYEQVVRCTPADYTGRICDSPSIVFNCSCLRFLFTWNWSLWARHASVLNATNEPPVITNPRHLLGTCIAKGQYVSTNKGLIPIEAVTTKHKVWTKDGWRKVLDTAYKGKKTVVKITSHSGHELICTPDHKILVLTLDGEKWIEAKDLKPEHYLCLTQPKESKYKAETRIIEENTRFFKESKKKRRITIPKTKLVFDKVLAEIMGYMIAEGSPSTFCNENTLLGDDFYKKWTSKFGKKSCVKTGIASVSTKTSGGRLLKKLGYVCGSYNKEIPQWIMAGDNEIIIACLRGMYAGDGNFRHNWSTYATVSKKLALQTQLLLARLGVRSYLRTYKSGHKLCDIWMIRTHDYKNTLRLYNFLNPIRKYSDGEAFTAGTQIHNSWNELLPKEFYELIRKSVYKACKIPVDNVLVKLNEVGLYSFGTKYHYNFVQKMKRKGLVTQQRFRASGKPTDMINLRDLEKYTRKKRMREILATIKVPPYTNNNGFIKSVSIDKLRKNLEPIDGLLPTVYEALGVLVNPNVKFDRVKSIKPLKKKRMVYDISVKGNEQFTVNGITVHNCKHGIIALKAIKARGY
jgi:intein/homing endonuclease